MKKFAVTGFVLILATLSPLRAEDTTGVRFGLKGGVWLSNVKWDFPPSLGPGETHSRRLLVGFLAEFDLSRWFTIQPELDLATTGFSWSDSLGLEFFEETQQYLQIPVLLKMRLVPEGWIVPAVFAGPSVGVLLRARFKLYDIFNGSISFADVKDDYRDFDLGAVFGAGAAIRVRNLRLLLDVRYYMSLANAYRFAGGSVKFAGLMFTGGLGF